MLYKGAREGVWGCRLSEAESLGEKEDEPCYPDIRAVILEQKNKKPTDEPSKLTLSSEPLL